MSERTEELVERVTDLSDTVFGDGHIHIETEGNKVILFDLVWVSAPTGKDTKYGWGTLPNEDLGAATKADEAIKEALTLVTAAMVEDFLSADREEAEYVYAERRALMEEIRDDSHGALMGIVGEVL